MLKVHQQGSLSLGAYVRINSGNLINSFGGHRKCIFRVLKNGRITIGNNVGISNSTLICAKEITIEDNVLIGGNCHIYDTDFHPISYHDRLTNRKEKVKNAVVLIKKNAFIGGGTYILKGVTIGERSIIASASVVTKSIPEDEIWGGNPAKFLKKVDSRKIE